MPSSTKVGSRPSMDRMRSYSSGVRPCWRTSAGVSGGSPGRECAVVTCRASPARRSRPRPCGRPEAAAWRGVYSGVRSSGELLWPEVAVLGARTIGVHDLPALEEDEVVGARSAARARCGRTGTSSRSSGGPRPDRPRGCARRPRSCPASARRPSPGRSGRRGGARVGLRSGDRVLGPERRGAQRRRHEGRPDSDAACEPPSRAGADAATARRAPHRRWSRGGSSAARSGCGIIPSTLRPSLVIPGDVAHARRSGCPRRSGRPPARRAPAGPASRRPPRSGRRRAPPGRAAAGPGGTRAVNGVAVVSTRMCTRPAHEGEARVARQRAGQQPGLAEDLEAVADAEHRQAGARRAPRRPA